MDTVKTQKQNKILLDLLSNIEVEKILKSYGTKIVDSSGYVSYIYGTGDIKTISKKVRSRANYYINLERKLNGFTVKSDDNNKNTLKQSSMKDIEAINQDKDITYFLVDSQNNHKVVGEFSSLDNVELYLDNKEYTENWENSWDTFQDFKDCFYTVTSDEMVEAVHKHGSRVRQYWT